MSHRIIVLEGITKAGLQILQAEGWTIDQKAAMPPAELAKIVGDYDALLLRSSSQITPEVFAAAKKLRVIGRPGVGVDNVDLKAATRHGVVVMNSPMGNMVSTAELAMALLLAVARNVAQADASMKAGKWDRKSFAGVELHGKRIGVIGFGRIGREVAARCKAFGMDPVAYDPFVAAGVAEAVGVPLLPLDELLAVSDYLTLHTTLTPETRYLLGKESLAKVKPGVRIVNAARGELIDPEALIEALDSGRVAGAGLDVYVEEPPKDWRLAQHPKVVATPHVGAQTVEAQERVGTSIAIQVRDFLKGGVISQAVNFFSLGGDHSDRVRPTMDLAERLGRLVAQVSRGKLQRVELGLYGDLSELDAKPIVAAALHGVMRDSTKENVTIVNAVSLAKEQGIEVSESVSTSPISFSNLLALRLKTAEGDVAVAGTLFGGSHVRLVEIDGVGVDAIPQGHLLLVQNDDTPGVIGQIGTLLGTKGVNIARMSVGRRPGSGRAIMLIEVDTEVPAAVVTAVAAIPGVRAAQPLSLG